MAPHITATAESIRWHLLDVATQWAIDFPFTSAPSAETSGVVFVATSQHISVPAYIRGFFNVTDDAGGSIVCH